MPPALNGYLQAFFLRFMNSIPDALLRFTDRNIPGQVPDPFIEGLVKRSIVRVLAGKQQHILFRYIPFRSLLFRLIATGSFFIRVFLFFRSAAVEAADK